MKINLNNQAFIKSTIHRYNDQHNWNEDYGISALMLYNNTTDEFFVKMNTYGEKGTIKPKLFRITLNPIKLTTMHQTYSSYVSQNMPSLNSPSAWILYGIN